MAKHSKEFKENTIKQMMPPINKTINEISKESGISEKTLQGWRRSVRATGIAAPSSSSTEQWSSEDKFLVVLETVKMNQAELARFCREKGLYVEQIECWKSACMNANGGVLEETKSLQKDLKTKEKEVKDLNKELRRKESALAEAAALLVLRKKCQAIWGDQEEE